MSAKNEEYLRVPEETRGRPVGESRPASQRESASSLRSLLEEDSRLLHAVHQGDVTEVARLLIEFLPLVTTSHGQLRITPLHVAAYFKPELVPLIIQHGADIEATDKFGRTALILACTAGHSECVQVLIKAGADVNSQPFQPAPQTGVKLLELQKEAWAKSLEFGKLSASEKELPYLPSATNFADFVIGPSLPVPKCWRRTALHEAAMECHPDCVQLLLNAGAKIEVIDDIGFTPLLLAGAYINLDDEAAVLRYEETALLLISNGADVTVHNPQTKNTSLHHAAAIGSIKVVTLCLENGAKIGDVNSSGRTVMHEAARVGSDDVLSVLLKTPGGMCLVNQGDNDGNTPVHLAAYGGARECVALLLRQGGGDLEARDDANVAVLDVICSKIARPEGFLVQLLDEGLETNEVAVHDLNFKVSLDFKILAPERATRQTAVVRGLLQIVSSPNSELIKHPLLETFLRLKWHRLRVFFFFLIFNYIAFLISLSAFIIVAHFPEIIEKNKTNCTEARPTWGPFIPYHVPLPHLVTGRVVTKVFLSITAIWLLVQTLVQAALKPLHYFKSIETWIIIISTTLSMVLVVQGGPEHQPNPCEGHGRPWAIHITCITIILAWTELLLLIGHFPRWGHYALMFYAVLFNVLKVFSIFICIIFGFSLTFFVQYSEKAQFNDPWKSLVKTVVMMTGEYDYDNLFEEGTNVTEQSRFYILVFVVVMSIVLMNLLVGLAVSDIQGIQAKGDYRRLLKQAEFVDRIESIVTHKIVQKFFPSFMSKLVEKRRVVETTLILQPSSVEKKLRQPQNLPYRLLESCVDLALRLRAKRMVNEEIEEAHRKNSGLESWMSSSSLNIHELLLRISTDLATVKAQLADENVEEISNEEEISSSSSRKTFDPTKCYSHAPELEQNDHVYLSSAGPQIFVPRRITRVPSTPRMRRNENAALTPEERVRRYGRVQQASPVPRRRVPPRRMSRRDVVSEVQQAHAILRRMHQNRFTRVDW